MHPEGAEEGREEPSSATSSSSFHAQYRLSGKLGAGAYAVVYGATHLGTNRKVAVKISDLRRSGSEGAFVGGQSKKKRYQAMCEVSILQRVAGRQNVVNVYEAFLEDGLHYIVMERCDGSVVQVLRSLTRLTENSLKPLLRDMLRGIQAIHQAGVVHRDVKPDNFLWAGRSGVRLCDFGLAAEVPEGTQGLPGKFGTAPFMAPEMLAVNSRHGLAVDIWSLGVTAYVLFYGGFPYRGVDSSGPAVQAAILSGAKPPTFEAGCGSGEGAGSVSKEATEWVRRLLCRDPTKRPTAADALQEAFLKQPGSGRQHDLKPMFLAALQAGFCDQCQQEKLRVITDVDHRLSSLQEPFQHSPGGAVSQWWSALPIEKADCNPVRHFARHFTPHSDVSTDMTSMATLSTSCSKP